MHKLGILTRFRKNSQILLWDHELETSVEVYGISMNEKLVTNENKHPFILFNIV